MKSIHTRLFLLLLLLMSSQTLFASDADLPEADEKSSSSAMRPRGKHKLHRVNETLSSTGVGAGAGAGGLAASAASASTTSVTRLSASETDASVSDAAAGAIAAVDGASTRSDKDPLATEGKEKKGFFASLATNCRKLTTAAFAGGKSVCAKAWNASGVGEWGITRAIYDRLPTPPAGVRDFVRYNRDWFVHALTDGATIAAIVKGSFANKAAAVFEYAIAGPRWIFGFSAFAENDENTERAVKRGGANVQKIQALRSWLQKIMVLHLASDAADVGIRATRDYDGINSSDGFKSMVTNITFATQVIDLLLASYATYLDRQDVLSAVESD